MRGHHYLRFWDAATGQEVEWATPAQLSKPDALDLLRPWMAARGYSYVGSTWRAGFDQRGLPSDSQPSYGEINTEQVRQPLFRNGEPTEASSDPLLVEREPRLAP